MENKIPRKFNKLTGEMLINTNKEKRGDILEIHKNKTGYLAFNTRTGKYTDMLIGTLKNSAAFKIIEVA